MCSSIPANEFTLIFFKYTRVVKSYQQFELITVSKFPPPGLEAADVFMSGWDNPPAWDSDLEGTDQCQNCPLNAECFNKSLNIWHPVKCPRIQDWTPEKERGKFLGCMDKLHYIKGTLSYT